MPRHIDPDIIGQIPGISRQRRYQLRHIKAGLCILCDEKNDGQTNFCTRHRAMKAKYMEKVNRRNRAARKKASAKSKKSMVVA